MLRDTKSDITPRVVGWTIVYGLNIILPSFYGAMICQQGGLVGMLAGIFAFYAVTLFFVVQYPRFGQATIRGGFLFAFTQFASVPQFLAGTLAIGVWDAVTGNNGGGLGNGNPLLAEVGGFACTIMTGQPLFALAVGLGYVLNLIVEIIAKIRHDQPLPEDE